MSQDRDIFFSGGVLMRGGLRLIIVSSVFLFPWMYIACGGGGGGESDMALGGTWVSDCFEHDSAYAWEKYAFNGKTGEMTGFLEEFQTSDCSGPGVILVNTTGTYSTGSEVDCLSGWNGKCTELDMTPDNKSTRHVLYSVFAGEDPDQIYLSSSTSDPATRADDVELDSMHWWRNVPCPGNSGDAIIGLAVTDTGFSSTPAAPTGYTALPIDLNGGTWGYYVWLSYKMGRADGLEGTPVGRIYTVHESDGETPLSANDTKVDVNLNGGTATNNFLWLYYSAPTDCQVVRCVVVANETDDETVYGPPAAQGAYSDSIVWIEELDPGPLKTPSGYPQPPDAQDLNESFGGDWIFLGYAVD
jgi:hypothetical protein